MKRFAILSFVVLALLSFATSARAQPILGTGCDGQLAVVGAEFIGTSGVYHYNCPPPVPPVASGPCVLLVGFPIIPIDVTGPGFCPVGPCGPASCFLGCNPFTSINVPAGGISIAVPPLVPSTMLCFQCACIDGPCIWLSVALKVTVAT